MGRVHAEVALLSPRLGTQLQGVDVGDDGVLRALRIMRGGRALTIRARAFVDASYLGDLLALAGGGVPGGIPTPFLSAELEGHAL